MHPDAVRAIAREDAIRAAAEFALDVLVSCVADAPGCDDPNVRRLAIANLKDALGVYHH